MNPETQTTGSNRSVADMVHRFQVPHSVSVACTERGYDPILPIHRPLEFDFISSARHDRE